MEYKKRSCKFVQEFNKLETAILRQDKYVEMFGHHRALLQVIGIVKENCTISCNTSARLKMLKIWRNSYLQTRVYKNETSSYVCTIEEKV